MHFVVRSATRASCWSVAQAPVDPMPHVGGAEVGISGVYQSLPAFCVDAATEEAAPMDMMGSAPAPAPYQERAVRRM